MNIECVAQRPNFCYTQQVNKYNYMTFSDWYLNFVAFNDKYWDITWNNEVGCHESSVEINILTLKSHHIFN